MCSLYLGENLISGVASPVEPTRNIGQIIPSTLPLTDAGLHLLDGSLIQGNGIYSAFVDYIADLYEADPTANYFAPSSTVWVQPVLSANGTLGGDSFAVSASSVHSTSYDTYMAFDNSSSTQWLTVAPASVSFPVNLIVYNPIALNCTSIDITNRLTYSSYFTAGNVYGSNDNSTWTLIQAFTNSVSTPNTKWTINLSNNTEYYKYYKIEFTSGVVDSGTPDASYGLTQVDLIATYQISSEEWWQEQVSTYGVCGKFVYDSVNNTVRLPKVTGILEGTTDVTALGDLIEAGLPNITGRFTAVSDNYTRTGAFTNGGGTGANFYAGTNPFPIDRYYDFNASRSSSLYKNNFNKVQPQTIKAFYYIVIATSTKTDIQVDIDEIATDLNGKADVDLSNLSNGLANTICTTTPTTTSSASSAIPAVVIENYVNGTSWYRVYSDGWCEQGGLIVQNSDYTRTINLLKSYSNTDYICIVCAGTNSYTGNGYGYIGTRNTDSFQCVILDSTSINACWQACGYIA